MRAGGALLEDLYLKQNLSIGRIAELFGSSRSTVIYWMEKLGIRRRRAGRHSRIGVTKEELHDMYWRKNFSTSQISEILGIHRVSAFRLLRKNGIQLRDQKVVASEIARNRAYVRSSFTGDRLQKQYLLGLSEDLSVEERSKWTVAVSLSTANPAMLKLFKICLQKYGHVAKYPAFDAKNGYYWRTYVYLDRSFEFMVESKRGYSLESLSNSEFYSRLAGLIDAEGSVLIVKNHKHIGRSVVIANERIGLIDGICKKLIKLGYHPNKYAYKRKGEASFVGNSKTSYRRTLWVASLNRKKEVATLLEKVQLRNEHKILKARFLSESLGLIRWDSIRTKLGCLKSRLVSETSRSREIARVELLKRNSSTEYT